MIVQNCYELLCELGQIENQIKEIQTKLRELGIECNDEALLSELITKKLNL